MEDTVEDIAEVMEGVTVEDMEEVMEEVMEEDTEEGTEVVMGITEKSLWFLLVTEPPSVMTPPPTATARPARVTGRPLTATGRQWGAAPVGDHSASSPASWAAQALEPSLRRRAACVTGTPPL